MSRFSRLHGASVIALAMSAACGVTSGSFGSSRLISASDIGRSGSYSAEELVRRTRPQLLLPRVSGRHPGRGAYTPIVYVDGLRQGGIEVLHLIPVSSLREVEYLPEALANVRFHGAHAGGAIVLTTIRSK